MSIPYSNVAISYNRTQWKYFASVKEASMWLAEYSGVNDWRKTRWSIYKVLEGYAARCYGFEVYASKPRRYRCKTKEVRGLEE